jgi:hypothetical protein
MATSWQPHRESLRTTLGRTIIIALVAGAILARWSGGRIRWPLATLLMLWISFGGHWVELWYLNWLRPRLPIARHVQIVARVATWFAGGVGLALCMAVTARALGEFRPARWPAWWLGGCAFIAVELLAHLALQVRGRPSFYNGQG